MMLQRPCRCFAFLRTRCLTGRANGFPPTTQSLATTREFSNSFSGQRLPGRLRLGVSVERSELSGPKPNGTEPSATEPSSTNPPIDFANNHAASSESSSDNVRTVHSSRRQDTLRMFMRTVPYPVAIVTASHQEPFAQPRSSTYAATVSSFNTVCLDPEPYVSFNLAAKSATETAIANTNHFSVTLLQNTTAAANLAARFTKGNHPSPFLQDDRRAGHDIIQFDDWEAPRFRHYQRPHAQGLARLPPGLQVRGATAFSLLCQRTHIVSVGNHVLIIGRVLRTADHSDIRADYYNYRNYESIRPDHTCLTYAHGSYSARDDGTNFGALAQPQDPYLFLDFSTVDSKTRANVLRWYNKRLGVIQLAMQKIDPTQDTKHAAHKLARSARYFQRRLREAQRKEPSPSLDSNPDPVGNESGNGPAEPIASTLPPQPLRPIATKP